MTKFYRSFSFVLAEDQICDIRFGTVSDVDCFIEPIPRILRSAGRTTSQKEKMQIYCDYPVIVAGLKKGGKK